MAEQIQLIDPKSGTVYNADAAVAEDYARDNGLSVATPEQVAKYDANKQLQTQSGGFANELATVPVAAANATGALVAGAANLAGRAGAAMNGLEAPAPVTAKDVLPDVLTGSAAQGLLKANPAAAQIGAFVPAVAAGALTAGAADVGLVGTAAIDFGVGGVTGEAGQAAIEDDRPMTASGVLHNGALSVAFLGAGAGLGAVYRKALSPVLSPLAESAQKAAISRLPRWLANGAEDLTDPAKAAEARGYVQDQAEATMSKLDSALLDAKPVVSGNRGAQQTALRGAADKLQDIAPDLSDELFSAASLPAAKRYDTLVQMAKRDLSDEQRSIVDTLAGDASLWGQKAVDHGEAVANAVAARNAGPEAFSEALRNIDDPAVQKLVGELDGHLEASSGIDAAQAFGSKQESTAGAAHQSYTDTDYDTAVKDVRHGRTDAKVLAEAAPGLRKLAAKNIGDAVNLVDDVMKNDISLAVKASDFAKGAEQWSPELIARQDQWVNEALSKAQDVSAEIDRNIAAGFDAKGLAAEGKKVIADFSKRLQGLSGGERNWTLDSYKRALDRVTSRATANMTLDASARAALMDTIKPLRDGLRSGLKDAQLFGRNGPLQDATNQAWESLIGSHTRVMKALSERTGKVFGEVGVGSNVDRAVPEDIERILGTNEMGGDNFLEDLGQTLHGADQLAQARQRFGITAKNRLGDMRSALKSIADDFRFGGVLNMAEEKAGARVAGHMAGLNPGGAVAAVGAHVLDATVARGYGRLVRPTVINAGNKAFTYLRKTFSMGEPALVADSKSALARVVNQHVSRYSRTQLDFLGDSYKASIFLNDPTRAALTKAGGAVAGAAAVVGATSDASAAEANQRHADADVISTARAMTDPEYAQRYATAQAKQPSTLEQFQGPHETLAEALTEKRQLVESFAQDPSKLIDSLGNAFGGLPDPARSLVTAHAFEVAQYLREELPPIRGVSVTRPNGLPANSLETRAYALKYQTAVDPSSAFADARAGRLRHEQVDTLQRVSPDTYDSLRSATLLNMGNGKASIVQRQRADLLFGFGASLDPAFSARLTSAAQEARGNAKAPTGASGPDTTHIPAATAPGGITDSNPATAGMI